MKSLVYITCLLLILSCKKEPTTAPAEVPLEEKQSTSKTLEKQCYVYEGNGNKIVMEIQFYGDDISGTLDYGLAEKDRNSGTITGKLENNILLLDYAFESEGIASVRQLAFKVENDKLIEGYGEMNEDGTHFKDVSQLKFTSTMPLAKVECKD